MIHNYTVKLVEEKTYTIDVQAESESHATDRVKAYYASNTSEGDEFSLDSTRLVEVKWPVPMVEKSDTLADKIREALKGKEINVDNLNDEVVVVAVRI